MQSSSWSPGVPATSQPSGFVPGQSLAPTTNVELSLSCNKLEDMDVFSKSDPFCVLYIKDNRRGGGWLCLDRTETIDNTLEPHWQKKFILQYKFEERQMLK